MTTTRPPTSAILATIALRPDSSLANRFAFPNMSIPKPRLATTIDTKFASSEYWFNQPATEKVEAADYGHALEGPCEQTIVDHRVFRSSASTTATGLLTTKARLTSRAILRAVGEATWLMDMTRSSATPPTRRRVVRFQIRKQEKRNVRVRAPRWWSEHYAMGRNDGSPPCINTARAFSTLRQLQETANRRRDGPFRVE